jgi:hypothetical protein
MAKPMKVFYDTEFLEDGHSIDLISIGMVREDGREFYAVSSEFNKLAVAGNKWLMDNVMSSIDHTVEVGYLTMHGLPVPRLNVTDSNLMSRDEIRIGILDFVNDIWPEFWAWYGAYDHVALCQLFGRMIDLPGKFPMFTNDLKQMHKSLTDSERDKMPKQVAGNHNALDDARFNVVRYNYMTEALDSRTTTW